MDTIENGRQFHVLNANAGSGNLSQLEELAYILTEGKDDVIVEISRSEADLEDILFEHKKFRPHIFGWGGGDGTAQKTLTKTREIWKKIPKNSAWFDFGTVVNGASRYGLSGGLVDKVKSKFGIDTKAIQLAKYLRDAKKLKIAPLNLLDINGRKGFSFGMGIAKALWLYYGKTPAMYQDVVRIAKMAKPEEYAEVLQNELKNNGEMRAGVKYAISAFFESLRGCLIEGSPTHKFFNERMKPEIWMDGELVAEDQEYLGFYGGNNCIGFGLNGLCLKPTPGANKESGKTQIAVTKLSPAEIPRQLGKAYRGERLPKTDYFGGTHGKFKLKQAAPFFIDGEWYVDKQVEFRVYQIQNMVSPFL
tara:strand:- start:3522 stop:4607 length:1086 start_codon:yes stop_codon:yes gene_type:complete